MSRALRKKLAKLAKGDERLQRLLKLAGQPKAAAEQLPATPRVAAARGGCGGAAIAACRFGRRRVFSTPPPPPPLPPLPPAAAPLVASRLVPSAIAVVVIAYNRPQYLDRALGSIFKHHPGRPVPRVRLAGRRAARRCLRIQKHGARVSAPRQPVRLKPGTYLAKFPGYAYLAIHYGCRSIRSSGCPQRRERAKAEAEAEEEEAARLQG